MLFTLSFGTDSNYGCDRDSDSGSVDQGEVEQSEGAFQVKAMTTPVVAVMTAITFVFVTE